ncbi:MAG: M23 family metallopeptidase [Pseudomonadota bacterium]
MMTAALSDARSDVLPLPQSTLSSFLTPDPIVIPRHIDVVSKQLAPAWTDTVSDFVPPTLQADGSIDAVLAMIKPKSGIWERFVAPGETLDAILAEAGLSAQVRAEASLALGAEYDLRGLRPGHSVALEWNSNGGLHRVELSVDDAVRIEVLFGERLATRVVEPDLDIVTLAGDAVIEDTVFGALEDAGLPVRFAIDLAQMLGGTVDLRRDLTGGEKIRLLWREARVGDETIGEPELTFAALTVHGSLYEVLWPEDGSGRATIYVDGDVLRVFAEPVDGARLSSVFGRRTHPVYGSTRMHTGVDFAAALGTPVKATAPGRVSFIGWRNGYGRVIEVAHGSDTVTRYAHLSAAANGLAQGQRVMAGDVIGRVGATGTATGPNLHYEVLVDGRPTDPLAYERSVEAVEGRADDGLALSRLNVARALVEEHLAGDTM